MYTFSLSSTEEHLLQILELQSKNIKQAVATNNQHKEGFVTVKHDLNKLSLLASKTPHAIVTYNQSVVGYALAMDSEYKNSIPELVPMFQLFDSLNYQGKPIENYLVMGQICVDKNHRKKGLFKQLYHHLMFNYSQQYNYIITEISKDNTPSNHAHHKVGFRNIHTFRDDIDHWNVVLWDWK